MEDLELAPACAIDADDKKAQDIHIIELRSLKTRRTVSSIRLLGQEAPAVIPRVTASALASLFE
jgi:hypothetical protein